MGVLRAGLYMDGMGGVACLLYPTASIYLQNNWKEITNSVPILDESINFRLVLGLLIGRFASAVVL